MVSVSGLPDRNTCRCCSPSARVSRAFLNSWKSIAQNNCIMLNAWLQHSSQLMEEDWLYVSLHFLFWSCDQYRAWTLEAGITNNNIITVFADLSTVFSQIILLSKLLTV